MRARMLFVVLVSLTSLTQPGSAAVWVFGDSNVDTGWYKIAPFSGDTDFDAFFSDRTVDIGKPTNNPGPMSVEVLATLLHTTAIPANQGGTNFATSGAKNFNNNADGFTNAVPTWTQLQKYRQQPPSLGPNRGACLPGGFIFCGRPRPGTNDIFLINSGGNDIGFAFKNWTDVADRTSYIELQARLLAYGISFLQAFGARQIIVANQQEGSGPSQDVKTARHNYNVALKSALDHFMKGAVYAWADVNSVREDIKADQAAGGTKFNIVYVDNTQHTACMMPTGNIATAWALICPTDPTTGGSPLNSNVSVQQTLFADDQHWASGAQRVLGSYYYCLIQATWPQLVPPTIQLPHEPKVPPFPCSAFSGIPPQNPKPPPLR